MELIVTVDTEEDNWGEYRPTGYSLENIDRIPGLQRIFDEFGVTPTYLITYPVAKEKNSFSILNAIFQKGRCEIGAHCHPWNTPPYGSAAHPKKESMLCNLPEEIQFKKISSLYEIIRSRFGAAPESFRCGRWGFSQVLVQHLKRLGFRIDSSVTPYTDWTKEYGPSFNHISPRPFLFNGVEGFTKSGKLYEIPPTIGYLQSDFTLCNDIYWKVQKSPFKHLRLVGILDRLNWVNKVWLSPEVSNAQGMIRLTRRMMENGYQFVNMFFHSNSLKAGLTPFVKTRGDEERFLQTVRDYLAFCREAGIGSIRLIDSLKVM